MKRVLSCALVFIGVMAIAATPARAAVDNDPATPYIRTVNPENAKSGDVITAVGSNLGKALVSELFLTLGKTDVKLEITSQKADQSVAKLPAGIEAGRYRLMILTTGVAQRFIEQPVQLTVD